MRIVRSLSIVVIMAFLLASFGNCECGDDGDCHGDTVCKCTASCNAGCCKSLDHDRQTVLSPLLRVSAVFIPVQEFHQDLVVSNIKHPPKTLI